VNLLRLIVIAAGSAALFTSAALPAVAGEGTHSVIELFTSQGCSSCPAADKVLAGYAERSDVLALSYNVDYWDYLGWKDTLATHDNTQRQRDYASARGDGDVYTPQAVIDGRVHLPGSQKTAIDKVIAENAGALSVPIDLALAPDAVTVKIPAGASDVPHATLWLVMYDRSVTVPINRGENTGRTVTYSNVVRKMRPIAMWTGAAMSMDLPRSEIEHAGADNCAVLLQTESKDGLPGPILGAATIRAGL
jgi:hypothetical protein